MVFLLLSLIVTAVTELIASFLKLRAFHLRRELAQILSDEKLKKKFYKNRRLLGTRADAKGVPTRWTHPSYIAPKAFSRALLLALSEKNGQSELTEQQLSSLRDTAKKIKSKPLRQLLLGLIDDTTKSISELEKDIAAWYDSATDRLSGYFKRRQQATSFIFGLAFAAAFNIDVLTLAIKVYSDAALRAELVAIGESYVTAHSLLGEEAARNAINKIECLSRLGEETAKDAINKIECLSDDLRGIALGWPDGFDFYKAVKHAPGWILAALASILGAPFWFDLLSRFIRIRGTGSKPQPAQSQKESAQRAP